MNESDGMVPNRWAFTVIIEPDDDGGYVVHCPALKGCWSQGETIDEALHNIVDAISGWLAVHIEHSLSHSYAPSPEQLTQPFTLSVQVP